MKRLRVLVADDHKAMLDNLVRILSSEFEVVAAVGDGGAVVTEAERVNPDVLVLDVAMPVMSGIAAADRLKSTGSTAKVVFVTMHHDQEFVAIEICISRRFRMLIQPTSDDHRSTSQH